MRGLPRFSGGAAGGLLWPHRRLPRRMVSGRQAREGGVKNKPVAVSPLEAHLGYWLRFVSNQVSHSFSLKLAERGVSVAEWVVLRELYECEAMAPSALAERIGMTRGAISKLADRLETKALVTRTISEAGRPYQAGGGTSK